MTVAASAEDLEEIASGKSSARDRAEAGVSSAKEAKALLQSQHNRKGSYRGHGRVKKPKKPHG